MNGTTVALAPDGRKGSDGRARGKRGPDPLAALEREIATLTARRAELATALANPEGDRALLGALGEEYTALDRAIAEHEARWEALVEAGAAG